MTTCSVHIALSQLPALLGIPSGGPELAGLVKGLLANIANTNPITVAIGLGVLAATFAGEKLDRRFPAPLLALIVARLGSSGYKPCRAWRERSWHDPTTGICAAPHRR